MTMSQFFEKKGPFLLNDIIKLIKCKSEEVEYVDKKIVNINDLYHAKNNELTFFNSIRYKEIAKKTNALACITSNNLKKYLPSQCIKLEVSNVLMSTALVSKNFFPKADVDYPDLNLKKFEEVINQYNNVSVGKNVLVGKNVKIGKNTTIGSNSIIESNVNIGANCIIGSFVVIKNSIVEDEVSIQDGCKIGIKGFGFVPSKTKNIKIPHIGRVLLKKGVEIGSGCTIDRGSMSDTVIDENTFLDNQVHVAHNVKIGKNCIIAGQVGFAGSTTLGNNVVIGGQAGISGHLTIGNNVSIGGGSGVIKNVSDNKKVMGYPAIDFKDFIKKWKSNENE